ncbi:acylphosphatase [Roseicella sp. DB1501]|uniref:acylphosphatase n=1 Tax=Roseicella sp. DB1501 TaxID=2730925 RepID=UPI0014927965|nr:acylphosphatase [Roseicella sp. DB1501]
MKARHLLIAGRVQGVGYRDWMQREAGRLGLAGWVRNRPDGRVEAVIAGPEPAVEALLTLVRRGPRLARVDAVEETFWEEEVAPGFARL